MKNEPKCTKCKIAMIKGYAMDQVANGAGMRPVWVEGEPEESFWGNLKTKNRSVFNISTFRCPNCNVLEFYTAERVLI